MEMKEGTSVDAHIKTMKKLTDRLAAINAPIAENYIVTLLGSLPSIYLFHPGDNAGSQRHYYSKLYSAGPAL